jgi:hypothetical protein
MNLGTATRKKIDCVLQCRNNVHFGDEIDVSKIQMGIFLLIRNWEDGNWLALPQKHVMSLRTCLQIPAMFSIGGRIIFLSAVEFNWG